MPAQSGTAYPPHTQWGYLAEQMVVAFLSSGAGRREQGEARVQTGALERSEEQGGAGSPLAEEEGTPGWVSGRGRFSKS